MTYILICKYINILICKYINIQVLSEVLHTETNLCGGNGGMIVLYESYSCLHHYNTQRLNYNHLPEIDTTCNQAMHIPVWL